MMAENDSDSPAGRRTQPRQIDLFSRLAIAPVQGVAGAPATIAPPAAREFIPTPPTLEWARKLALSETGHRTVIFVSTLWTGVVIECLSDPKLGRLLLHRDGTIQHIAPDHGARGRTIYMDARQALALHARHPLLPVGCAGTHSARFRFAETGEQPPATLPLPEQPDAAG